MDINHGVKWMLENRYFLTKRIFRRPRVSLKQYPERISWNVFEVVNLDYNQSSLDIQVAFDVVRRQRKGSIPAGYMYLAITAVDQRKVDREGSDYEALYTDPPDTPSPSQSCQHFVRF